MHLVNETEEDTSLNDRNLVNETEENTSLKKPDINQINLVDEVKKLNTCKLCYIKYKSKEILNIECAENHC